MNPFGIQAYRSKRMPRAEKALYIVGAIGIVVALIFNNFH